MTPDPLSAWQAAPLADAGLITVAACYLAGAWLIINTPDGDFIPQTRALTDDDLAALETRRPDQLTAAIPRHIIPLPTPSRINAQVRARLNRFYTSYRLETPSSYGQPGSRDDQGPSHGSLPGHEDSA